MNISPPLVGCPVDVIGKAIDLPAGAMTYTETAGHGGCPAVMS